MEFRSADDLIALKAASLPPAPAVAFPKVTRDIPAMSADGARPIDIELITTKDNGLTTFDIKGGPFWRGTSVRAAMGEKAAVDDHEQGDLGTPHPSARVLFSRGR